jgi:ABC-type polysaccharide/polyol phosphate transport system ATPase subunit
MTELAIRVEGLGKKYPVVQNQGQAPYRTLRESLTGLAGAAWRHATGRNSNSTVEDFWALKDVNFEVSQGEAVAIIGRPKPGTGQATFSLPLSAFSRRQTIWFPLTSIRVGQAA